MKSNVMLSMNVSRELAKRIEAAVENMRDPYGKRNRAFTLRVLVEKGLQAVEAEARPVEMRTVGKAAVTIAGWTLDEAK